MKAINTNAVKIMLGILSATIIFHLLILLKIVPYEIAWGGRLENDAEMYVFETLSIFIVLFLCLILLMKGKYLKYQFRQKIINSVLWGFLVLFILNTIGNLFAETTFEKFFAIVTGSLAYLIWIVVKKDKQGEVL